MKFLNPYFQTKFKIKFKFKNRDERFTIVCFYKLIKVNILNYI